MSARAKSNLSFEIIKDTYIGVLKKYVVIKGRARRREFWIFFFCNLVLGLIPVVGTIVALLTCVPGITVGVRRLHDTNRTGKWLLLGLFPLVGLILLAAGALTGSKGIIVALIILVVLVSIGIGILLLVWAAQEGTRGRNKYGPDPKAGRR